MSNYESMRGHAKLKGKDFAQLRRDLIAAFNQDISTIKKLAKQGIKKANSRTLEFDIIVPTVYHGETELSACHYGYITLNKTENTVRFYIEENNHAVDKALETNVMKVLMRFFENMENKGKIYGAKTVYSSEYHRCDGLDGEPDVDYYGAWIDPREYRHRLLGKRVR